MASVANPSPVRQIPVDAVTPWWEQVDWWTDAGLAYIKGLIDGAAMERARLDVIDDQRHRETVRRMIRFIDQVDARRRADRGQSSEGQQAA